jgi:hypothetical protein
VPRKATDLAEWRALSIPLGRCVALM